MPLRMMEAHQVSKLNGMFRLNNVFNDQIAAKGIRTIITPIKSTNNIIFIIVQNSL